MGIPLPLTLLGVMNPCHLQDERDMTRSDDTTNTLSKHRGSLCYSFTGEEHMIDIMCTKVLAEEEWAEDV
jgi:hypothetical protein